MAILVQKYGGTSVGSLEKIKKVAEKVVESKRRGDDIVVVVSAMAGETDRLDKLAWEISNSPSMREYDILVSSGEQVSSALLTMAINALGENAISLSGFQIPIKTSGDFSRASVEEVDATKIKELVSKGYIVVIAGFQGIDEKGNVTTLGRGGSDITAVAIASSLEASKCELFKDVSGVFTADPAIVENARRIPEVSYDQMLELSSMGAKVVHSRAVQIAKRYNVPIEIKSSFENGQGTIIGGKKADFEGSRVVSITLDRDIAKISVGRIPNKSEVAHRLFKATAEHQIFVDMIVQSISRQGLTDITFMVPRKDRLKVVGLVKEITKDIEGVEIYSNPNIVKISVIGDAMKIHYGTAAKVFGALAKERINLLTITTSEIKISCAISEKYAELAVRSLHEEFGLGTK
jgi:aspartate kinase